jgi:outer membrane protein assembly factor BamA
VIALLAAAALTTAEARPEEAPGLGWALLQAPEHVLQVVATPLGLAIAGAERVRLDRRVYDLLTNDERTLFVLPGLTYSGTQGIGGSLTIRHTDLFGHSEHLTLQAQGWAHRDWDARGTFDADVAAFGDRRLRLSAGGFDDRRERWFGLGGDTTEDDERALRVQDVDAHASLGLLRGHAPIVQVLVEGGWRRRTYGPGDRPDVPPAGPDDDIPGFDERTGFPEGGLRLRIDTRDTEGRTTRGGYHELSGVVTQGDGESALGGRASTAWYLQVAPRARVLVLALAAEAVRPLRDGDEVPLHRLVTLGRDEGLRGYPDGRFRGNYGWNGTVEYRYPLYTLWNSGITSSATLFGDVGRVAEEPAQLAEGPIRWSAGFGLRAESAAALIFGVQVGFSPEGAQVVGGVGLAP